VDSGCEAAAPNWESEKSVKMAPDVETISNMETSEMPAKDSETLEDLPIQKQEQGGAVGSEAVVHSSTSLAPASSPSHGRGAMVVDENKLRNWRLWSFRAEVYNFIEDPSTPAAKAVSTLVLAVIMLSIVSFVMETHPKLRTADAEKGFWYIEVICTVVFTTEYMLRLWVCDVFETTTRSEFVRDKTNLMDLLAILPFYVDMALNKVDTDITGLRVLRSIRLIRLFRVFKLGKYSAGMALMVATIRGSVQAIAVMAFILGIEIILFSSLAYHAEKLSCPDVAEMKRTNQDRFDAYIAECEGSSNGWTRTGEFCCTEFNAPMGFDTIVATFWWNVVTVTTVGFGDSYPKTWQGKLVGAVAMLVGILVLSLPTGVIGAKFEEVYQDFEDEKARQQAIEEQDRAELEESERERRGSHGSNGSGRRSSLLGWLKPHKAKGEDASGSADSASQEAAPQKGMPSPPPVVSEPPPPPTTEFVGGSVAASSSGGRESRASSTSRSRGSRSSGRNSLRALASAGSGSSPNNDVMLGTPSVRAPCTDDLPDALETTKDFHKQLRDLHTEEILPEAMQNRVDHIARLLAVDYRLELQARDIRSKHLAAQHRARDAYQRLAMLVSRSDPE
jgi:hypothetical protein